MNMIVKKSTAQYGLCGGERSFGRRESACAAEMRAHKYGFGGVSEQLNYISPPPNGLSSPPVEATSNSALQYVMGAS